MERKALPLEPATVFAPVSRGPGAILLETQRPDVRNRFSYLLHDPASILSSSRADEVVPLLEEAHRRLLDGMTIAGFVSYEAGYSLDRAFSPVDSDGREFPLVWLGVYGGSLRFDHIRRRWATTGGAAPPPLPELEPGEGALPSEEPIAPGFSIPEDEHARMVDAIRRAIARGDVYQANLTGKFSFPFRGDPYALYLRLRQAQPVKYGAFLRTGTGCIVSQSPELFFRVRGAEIETCPMKGTAARGLTTQEDRAAAAALKRDVKNRAENVMIVDLLRNDLGRVCLPGSIRASRLFEVERYPTVLQMVSTVAGKLSPGASPASLFRALFPCGSVTGAPKISAVRLLRSLEKTPRGVFTGAIGIMLPGGDMTFSVAIRTVTVRGGIAEAGAGGGIVWDSTPSGEFLEAALKGRFLAEPPLTFELIETFLYRRGGGFRFLEEHLRRLSASARYFGFRFRRERVLSALASAVRAAAPDGARKVRLLLARSGDVSVELDLPPPAPRPARPLRIALSGATVSSRDPFVRHKTTNRAWRDEELRKARESGFDEVLFLNERGELTEGAITNVFLEIDGVLATPPASCGLLAGVFRGRVLSSRRGKIAEERVLFPEDLEKARVVRLTNSLRGIVPAAPSLLAPLPRDG